MASAAPPTIGVEDVRAARRTLEGTTVRTPTFTSRTFAAWTGATTVHLKAENLQRTGSFKLRGATNRLAQLTPEERRTGVVTSSAGNHAQGVALAAAALGVPATVYMPVDAPLAKQLATRAYGAEIVLEGITYDDAHEAARRAAGDRPFIPAFDDPAIVAGQGTVALELLEDAPDVDLVLVPLGGGGLLAGIATVLRELRPSCRIVGVQADGCAPFAASLSSGSVQSAAEAHTIADGIAVKRPGDVTFPIIQSLVDDVISVTDEEICEAIVSLLERSKLVVEGAGAVGLAALLSGHVDARGRTVACILSGGNLDAGMLQAVVRYALTTSGRYLVVRTKLSDKPGSLLKLLEILARDRINIIDVEHHREGMDVSVTGVEVELTVETRDQAHCQEVLAAFRRHGYEAERVR